MTTYNQFLQDKIERSVPTGFEVTDVNPHFYPYQALVSKWGLRQGNYLGALAVGMGKTILDVIQRCITRWSNPDDVVYDYFSGIGSVTVKAIEMRRYGLGSELKEAYFQISAGYCQGTEAQLEVPTLFDINGIG